MLVHGQVQFSEPALLPLIFLLLRKLEDGSCLSLQAQASGQLQSRRERVCFSLHEKNQKVLLVLTLLSPSPAAPPHPGPFWVQGGEVGSPRRLLLYPSPAEMPVRRTQQQSRASFLGRAGSVFQELRKSPLQPG